MVRYLIFMDINNFKSINDTYGHDIGDLVLIHFGNILAKVFYKDKESKKYKDYFVRIEEEINSKVCRYGGDELIVLVNLVNENQLKALIQNLHKELLKKFTIKGNTFDGLSASVGIINLDDFQPIKIDDGKRNTPIDVADLVMYFAKGLAKRKFIIVEKMGKEIVRSGLIVVHEWDDFKIIEDYSKLLVGLKPAEKKEEIEEEMLKLLDDFYQKHKELFSHLKDR